MKTKEIGNITTCRGEVIDLDNGLEVCLSGKTWYDNVTYGTIFKKGDSPLPSDDIDWNSLSREVKIIARGGSYANEMYDCVVNF